VGNRLDPNLLTEEQERIDVAWRAWNIALHAELTSSTNKKAAGLTALLASEYTTIEKDLDDLFVTLPALADDVRIAEQSAARRLLQEKWEASEEDRAAVQAQEGEDKEGAQEGAESRSRFGFAAQEGQGLSALCDRPHGRRQGS